MVAGALSLAAGALLGVLPLLGGSGLPDWRDPDWRDPDGRDPDRRDPDRHDPGSGLASRFGPLRWWVADRGARELLGLDAELFCVARVPWPTPVRLAPAPMGLWVAAALEGHPDGLHRLSLLEDPVVDTHEVVSRELDAPLDLTALSGGGLAWLSRGASPEGPARLERLEPSAHGPRVRATPAPPGSTRLAAALGGLAVGTERGTVWWLRGRWRAGPRVGERVLDLAGSGEGLWVLGGASAGLEPGGLELVHLGPGLEQRARLRLPGNGGRLALRGPRGVLVATSGSEPRCLGVGPEGEVRDLGPLGHGGVAAVLPEGTGWIAVAPGAVLRGALLELDGRALPVALPGQGGFDHLTDLAGPFRP